MGKIFRDMTAEEQAYYDEDSKKFPWLKTITMSDDEFFFMKQESSYILIGIIPIVSQKVFSGIL